MSVCGLTALAGSCSALGMWEMLRGRMARSACLRC